MADLPTGVPGSAWVTETSASLDTFAPLIAAVRSRQTAHAVIRDDHGDELHLIGTGYAVRCAVGIAHDNWPDARWALEVLNRYGHLVHHPGDGFPAPPVRVSGGAA